MPTPTGLPKAGERISFGQPLPSNNWKPTLMYGTVVARGTGDFWTLYVRWDPEFRRPGHRGSHMGRDVEMMVDAAYHLKNGHIKVIG